MRPKLMIPGPVDIWDETLIALGEQVLPYYGAEWEPIFHETLDLLAQVFQTQNDIFMLTAPGSGAVETCVASLFAPGDKVAVISNGPFANRAIEIMRAYRLHVLKVTAEWGTAGDPEKMRQTLAQHPDTAGVVVVANETGTGVRNPVQELAGIAHTHNIPILVDAISAMGGYNLPVDEWELDLVCTSSNKALEIPPGLGIISVSDRAWQQIDAKTDMAQRGWYYNLATWKPYRRSEPGARVSPATTATSLVVALNASLKRILEEETLTGHWERYAWARHMLRTGLDNMGFKPVVCEEHASYTVTTAWIRDDMEAEQPLRDFMLTEHGYMLSTSWGPMTGKVLRIGHMGKSSSPDYLIPCLLGIEDYVRRILGVDLPTGAGLVGLNTSPVNASSP